MKLLDTNAILRYLLGNIKEQQMKVKAVIDDGSFTTPEVLAEVIYILTGYYNEERESVYKSLIDLFLDVHIDKKEAILEDETSLDFVDCVLIGRNHVLGDDVFNFDKKLNKRLISVNR